MYKIENDKFSVLKRYEIENIKEGYFLNKGLNLIIKREKDWIMYKSKTFEKLQRIDKRKIKCVATCNKEMLCYIQEGSIVVFAKQIMKKFFIDYDKLK
jgi:hypothetical protein